jgi:uncharacterized protein YdeI (YjbR/CyaY-like superfamily)
MAGIQITEVIYPKDRSEWRKWLQDHFETSKEVWVAISKKDKSMDYNDMVEEALCFNWIDSTLKTLDENYTAQRMSPRRSKAGFSQLNIERIQLILSQGLAHPKFAGALEEVANTPFTYAADILKSIQNNPTAWKNFRSFPEPYKRMKVASIEAARKDIALFEKRLNTFILQCEQNKQVAGIAGMDKYY